MSSESDSQPQVDTAYQDALAENENPQLNWNGEIQYEDDSKRAEFVATDHRLLYRTDGVMKNMGLNHVSSVETSSKSNNKHEDSNPTRMFVSGLILGVLGFVFVMTDNPLLGMMGIIAIIVGGLLIRFVLAHQGEFESVEETIYHINLIRANEEPLHITTKQNVGSDLSRLITEAQSN